VLAQGRLREEEALEALQVRFLQGVAAPLGVGPLRRPFRLRRA